MKVKLYSILCIFSLLFILSCFDDSGSGDDSDPDGDEPATILQPPTTINAAQESNKVIIYFGRSIGATSYNLYWTTTPGVTKTGSTKIANITTPFTLDSLTNGTYYYFAISAVDKNGESNLSEEVNAIPSPQNIAFTGAPADVTAEGVTVNGNSCIKLKWKAVYAATSYTIYWSTTSGFDSASALNKAGELSPATIYGPFVTGTRYYLKIKAKNTGNESGDSAEISAIAP